MLGSDAWPVSEAGLAAAGVDVAGQDRTENSQLVAGSYGFAVADVVVDAVVVVADTVVVVVVYDTPVVVGTAVVAVAVADAAGAGAAGAVETAETAESAESAESVETVETVETAENAETVGNAEAGDPSGQPK